ncbi:MAG: PQQ-binding-like beta-propeller repeat protein, partial [Verrucomicrobiota bacterium]
MMKGKRIRREERNYEMRRGGRLKGFPFQNDSARLRVVKRAAAGLIMVAGLFCIVMSALTIANYARMRSADPVNDPSLVEMRAEYARTGEDSLKQRIRALDLVLRKEYFARLAQVRIGGFMLLAGFVVLFASLQVERLAAKKLPEPRPDDDSEEERISMASARKAIGSAGLVFAVLTVILIAVLRGRMDYVGLRPEQKDEEEDEVPEEYVFPARAELERNWPGFRGVYGHSRSVEADPPVTWSENPDTNILWKAEAPRSGFSSPVVWDNRVFITGGDDEARELYCYNAATGEMEWSQEVGGYPGSPKEMPEVTEDTGLAAPTPATDGNSVVALFGTGDIACFSMDGILRWAKNTGVPQINYGYASSPVIYKNHVFIQYHQDADSRVFALDIRTGEQIWNTWQESRASWATQLLITEKDNQWLAVSGNPTVSLHDAFTGKEEWSVEASGGEPAPSPAWLEGKIFTASDYAGIACIDPASGEILWQNDLIDLPSVSSPLAADGLLFVCSSYGTVSCLDAGTGEVVWTHDFQKGFYSSPVLVDGKIYAIDRKGAAHIFEAAREYRALSQPSLEEPVDSTPAFVGSRMYVRSRK